MPDSGLADRLDRLWTAASTANGRRLSCAQVATAVLERQQVYVSREYLRQLRTGKKSNPRPDLVRALAAFFGVSTAYLFNGEDETDVPPNTDPVSALGVPVAGTPGSGKTRIIRDIIQRCEDNGIPVLVAKRNSNIDAAMAPRIRDDLRGREGHIIQAETVRVVLEEAPAQEDDVPLPDGDQAAAPSQRQ